MAKKLFVLPVFSPAQYDAFRREIGANLADTYDEWRKLFADDLAEAARQGKTIVEVQVDYDEFIVFCRAAGHNPDAQILANFAETKKRP